MENEENRFINELKNLLASLILLLIAVGIGFTIFTFEAKSAEIVTASIRTMDVAIGQGRLIRLKAPAATVFIADPEIADIQIKSPSLVYMLGRKPGTTTLYAVDGRERVLANMDITVTHNLKGLKRTLEELLPAENIHLASVNSSLVLDGDVSTSAQAEEIRRLATRYAPGENAIINRLKVTEPIQVNLRVRIAEITRDIDKQFGFNWTFLGSIGGAAIGLSTGNVITSTIADNLVSTAAASSHSLSIGGGALGGDLNAFVDALEQEGLVSILAEPNLTAMSGETASFLAGGEFPILVPQGTSSVTIEFREYGISLAFTPTILSGNRINLHVKPEVSSITSTNAVSVTLSDDSTIVVPSLTTRRAETTVEVGSGQSFAIAGLLQNNTTHDISQIPGLGDVPVLGNLFKSDRFQRDETELVIMVTPYIVRPVSNRAMASPTDGYIAPHDAQRLFGGGTNRRSAKKSAAITVGDSGRGLIGPVGFELN